MKEHSETPVMSLVTKKFIKHADSNNPRAIYYINERNCEHLNNLDFKSLITIIKLISESVKLLEDDFKRVLKKITKKGPMLVTKETINEFVVDILTPSGGEEGCSEFEHKVRKKFYKEDGTYCPYIYCRYWFDNEEWCNCSKLVMTEAAKGGGWVLEDIGKIKNLLGRGQLSRERIRQMEVEAIKHLTQKGSRNKKLRELAETIIEVGKGEKNVYGLRT